MHAVLCDLFGDKIADAIDAFCWTCGMHRLRDFAEHGVFECEDIVPVVHAFVREALVAATLAEAVFAEEIQSDFMLLACFGYHTQFR